MREVGEQATYGVFLGRGGIAPNARMGPPVYLMIHAERPVTSNVDSCIHTVEVYDTYIQMKLEKCSSFIMI